MKFGNHRSDYINNPNPFLFEAINKAEETGLFCSKITFFRFNTEDKLTKDFVTEHSNDLRDLLPSNSIFKNTFSN